MTAIKQDKAKKSLQKMLAFPERVLSKFLTFGILRTCSHALDKSYDYCYELWLGVHTAGNIHLRDLGIDDLCYGAYQPTSYCKFRKIMKNVRISQEDVFVDYGAGKGRVLVLAGMFPFRRVIGVEISPDLKMIAEENLRKAKPFLKSPHIEVIEADAASYILPNDATVLYFFNPFTGPILARTFERIRVSLLEAPRRMTIIFNHSKYFEDQINSLPWMTKRKEIAISLYYKCAIYDCHV
jgi:hypothetical protein